MRAFTIVVGIATLVSLGLQLTGLFAIPNDILWYSATFFGGLTLGLAMNIIFASSFSFPTTPDLRELLGFVLYCATGLLIATLFVLGAVLEDEARRADAQRLGSAVSGFLIFMLLFMFNAFFDRRTASSNRVSEDSGETMAEVDSSDRAADSL